MTAVTLAVLVLLLAGALLALAVRTGPGIARAGALLAMAALGLAALVPPRPVAQLVPARVALATGDAAAVPEVAAIARRAAVADGRAASVAAVADAALPRALALAAMQAGPRRDEVIAIWSGPLAAAPPLPFAVAGAAFTTATPLPFEPTSLSLRAVGALAADRPLRLEAAVLGSAAPVAATITVTAAGGAVSQRDVVLPTVGTAAVEFEPPAAGELAFQLAVACGEHRIERRGSVAVAAPPPVLVLEPSNAIAAALRAQGVQVEAAAALPAELGRFVGVVLGTALPIDAQERLVAAVGDGLGLFALGAGLQREGEPLRALWPLRIRADAGDGDAPGRDRPAPRADAPPDPAAAAPAPPPVPPPSGGDGEPVVEDGGPVEVDRHAVAMVLVVDRSGSMGTVLANGATKMSFVKTSALSTARALGDGDQVALVTFGDQGQGRVELPLTAATDRAAVAAGVDKLAHAHEYTFLLSGLRLARDQLAGCRAAVRHIVVLTDGEYIDFEQVMLQSLAHELRAKGVTVSIVSIVDDDTDPQFFKNCELLAQEGGGQFLPVRDVTRVPQLVSAEVVRTLDRVGRKPRVGAGPGSGRDPEASASAQRPEPTPSPPAPSEPPAAAAPAPPARVAVRAVAASPLLLPATAAWPTLGAVLAAKATADAHVLLVAGDAGEPLLAYGNRGLGRVGVFAADLAGADGAEFRRQPAFAARLSQWVAATRPPAATAPRELLTSTRIAPPAPPPADVAQLSAGAAGPLQPLAAFALPPPRTIFASDSQVWRFAAGAVLLLLALACLEWWAARRLG